MNHHMSGIHRPHALAGFSASMARGQPASAKSPPTISLLLEDPQALAQWQISLAELRRKDAQKPG